MNDLVVFAHAVGLVAAVLLSFRFRFWGFWLMSLGLLLELTLVVWMGCCGAKVVFRSGSCSVSPSVAGIAEVATSSIMAVGLVAFALQTAGIRRMSRG